MGGTWRRFCRVHSFACERREQKKIRRSSRSEHRKMLTAEQLALRESKITASIAPPLMAGNEDVILNKWLELIGDPGWKPEDFSTNWPIQFGAFIETFALDWHERRTQQALARRG